MNRLVRTGRQPGNKKKSGKNSNSRSVSGLSLEERNSESISDCNSNNVMEIPPLDDDAIIFKSAEFPKWADDSKLSETPQTSDSMLRLSNQTTGISKGGPLSDISEGCDEEGS